MRLGSGIAAGSLLLPSVAAWGELGHITVAYLASTFVQEETAAYFKQLLDDQTENYLASVATWADDIRDDHSFDFTHDFHYIDAHDRPPKSCNVQASDCKADGCVISAIANYTSRSLDTSLDDEEVMEAAKFLIHFIGDIHQPLHTEDARQGGTKLFVKWHGQTVNLHRVWDSSILEEMVGNHDQSSFSRAHELAASLASEIQNGKYTADSKKWLSGLNLDNPNMTTMNWANEVNHYVCSTVLPDGPNNIDHQHVDGAYAEKAEPVIDTLLARAGYRLAAWLNLIANRMNESARAASVGGEL